MSASAFNRLKKLQDEAHALLSKASSLEELLKLFPDLEVRTLRGGEVLYGSREVNQIATAVELCHSCGCCSDANLLARPYIETPHGKVYSYPMDFVVGEQQDWIHGSKPVEGWARNLRGANIPESLIENIREKFRVDIERRREIAARDPGHIDE